MARDSSVIDVILDALSEAPESVYRNPPSATGTELAKVALTAPDAFSREEFFERALADPGQMSAADIAGLTDLEDLARVGEYVYEHGPEKALQTGAEMFEQAVPVSMRPGLEAAGPALPGLAAIGSLAWLMSGRPGLGRAAAPGGGRPRFPGRQAGQTGYHGSPHKFDQFDISKIGTGEGSQAYGHGLYFAENPETAKTYARSISARSNVDKMKLKYQRDSAIERGDMGRASELQDQLDELGGQNLYEVDIPDEAIDNMLDWDAPLSEQPEKVQKAFEDIRKKRLAYMSQKRSIYTSPPEEILEKQYMGAWYDDMAEQLGSQQAASDYLNSLGIPGIKYFDQGSRQAGEGTRNFVVFDDSLVTIKDHGGQAGVIGPVADDKIRLFNASTVDRDPQGYLEPHVSDWVDEVAHGAGDIPVEDITSPLVYMSDEPDKWVPMIVARKIGKHPSEVTMSDIKKHGRLNVVEVDPEYDKVYQVGDYFNDESVTDIATGDRIKFYESDLYDEGDVYSGEGRMVEMPVGPEPPDFIAKEALNIERSLTGQELVDFLQGLK